MKKNWLLFLLVISSATPALAAPDLVLSAQQKLTLGIKTVVLPAKQQGELAGLPALVVIPANQLFTVSTPLSAMVEQTLVGVGDTVARGQVLATLQSPALVEAQRGLLQAATQMQLAEENMARDEKLWQDGIISESRFRATQSQYRETSAAFNERKQVLRLAGLSDEAIAKLQREGNLNSLLSVISPISGVILEKTASAGQRLEAAVPLFKVAKINPLSLEIQAPLAKTQGLKVGATVNVRGYAASGKLTAIGHSLSGGNQTILLRVLITKGAQNLRPGQYLEATIDTQTQNRYQWNVPNAALARVAGQIILFVETRTGFRSVPAKVLHESDQMTLISAKLSGQEAVAVQGVSALKAQLMGIGGAQ